jgi:hypothetical protein
VPGFGSVNLMNVSVLRNVHNFIEVRYGFLVLIIKLIPTLFNNSLLFVGVLQCMCKDMKGYVE